AAFLLPLAVLFLLLLGANLWALLTLSGRLAADRPGADRPRDPGPAPGPPPSAKDGDPAHAREKFALAVYRLLSAEPAPSAQLTAEGQGLIERYRPPAPPHPPP